MATFGYATIGGSTNADSQGYKSGTPFVLAEAGSVTKLTLYCAAGTATSLCLRGLVHADAAGSPGAFLGAGTEITIADGAGAAWRDLPFAVPIVLAAGTYWLCHWAGAATNSWTHYFDAGATLAYKPQTYASTGPPDDPFGTPQGTDNQKMSIYATYTATATAVPRILTARNAV